MSALEATYREALRWYPRSWRAANEDAALGTLLDQAEAVGRAVPASGELADLRRSGVRARVAIAGRLVPPGVRERAGVITLALGATIGAAGLEWSIRQYFYIQAVIDPRFPGVELVNIGVLFYVIWVAALVTGLIGLRRITAALVALSIPASVVLTLIGHAYGFWGNPGAVTSGFLALLAIIHLAGMRRNRSHTGRPLAAIFLGFAAAYALIVWAGQRGYWGNGALGVDGFWGQFAVWLTFLGLPAVVVAALVLWRLRRTEWAPAMLLAAVPILPLSLVEFGYATSWLDNIGAAAVALVGVAIVLAILRAFGVRIRFTRA